MKMAIATAYYDHNHKEIKVNYSKDPNSASVRCYARMKLNTYGASSAEIYDAETGLLYEQFTLDKKGDLKCAWKYNPRDYKAPMRIKLDILLKEL